MIDVSIRLWRPAFHGCRDTGEADWPPSPTRLIGALLSGAHGISDDALRTAALDGIQRITELPAPVITAPTHTVLASPPTFTERTWKPAVLALGEAHKFLDLSHLAMSTSSRTQKPQGAISLAGTEISYRIEGDLTADHLKGVQAAAALLPYFGTSKDKADVNVGRTELPPEPFDPATQLRWFPVARANGESRGWQPNTVEWFNLNYERVFGVDPLVSDLPQIPAVAYTRPLRYVTTPPTNMGTFPVFSLTRSVPHHVISHHVWTLNCLLRDAGELWRVIPLTVSNSEHADGRMVGVGLVAQPDVADDAPALPSDDLVASIEQALEAIEETTAARFARQTRAVGQPKALSPQTWVGPSATWYSATPLRAFPDERVARYQLIDQIRERYGVEVEELHITRDPAASFAGRWPDRPHSDGLEQWWAAVVLTAPVSGPLLLGSANEYGFGLFHEES